MQPMEFGEKVVEPDIRLLGDMKDVIHDGKWFEQQNPDEEVYYMYRDLALSKKDREVLTGHGLRYDITVIPPRMLADEYVKTLGHYHPPAPGTHLSYTELYEVLSGEAVYLLQRLDRNDPEVVEDVIVVEAGDGDKLLIPPNYGHITINRSRKTLKMANLVSRDFKSNYEPVRAHGGGAYFLTTEGSVKNSAYASVAPIRYCKPTNTSLAGLSKQKEIYRLLRTPEVLGYLTTPQDYTDLFEKLFSECT